MKIRQSLRLAAALLAGLAAPLATAQVASVATYVSHMNALAAGRSAVAGDQLFSFTNSNGSPVNVRIRQPGTASAANTITISPNGGNDYNNLVTAIASVRAKGRPARLVLTAGTYNFTTVDNANSTALLIDNLDNVTIDGNGSTLLVKQVAAAILITNSATLRINNLKVDYGIPLNAKGQILKTTGFNGGAAYLRVFPPVVSGTTYPLDDTAPVIGIHAFSFGANVDANRWLGGSYRNRPGDMTKQDALRTNANGSIDYRISAPLETQFGLNEFVLVCYWGKGPNNAIRLGGGNSDLTLNALTVHSSPFMGINAVMGMTAGLWLNNCRIEPNPAGVNPNISSNIDAINLENCSDVAATGTTTQLTGDDGINVHQDGAAVTAHGTNTLTLSKAVPGDIGTLHLFDANFGYIGRCAYTYTTNNRQITLTSPPAGYVNAAWVGGGYTSPQNGFASRVYIRNCTFIDSLARGILPLGLPNGLIELCTITRTNQSGILLHGESAGTHLGANALWTINNNNITTTNTIRSGVAVAVPGDEAFFGAIGCAVEVGSAGAASTYPLLAKLRITNNAINNTPKAGISIVSSDSAFTSGNVFTNCHTDGIAPLNHNIVRALSTNYSGQTSTPLGY